MVSQASDRRGQGSSTDQSGQERGQYGLGSRRVASRTCQVARFVRGGNFGLAQKWTGTSTGMRNGKSFDLARCPIYRLAGSHR